MSKKSVKQVMDPEFQEAHVAAFKLPVNPEDLKKGDIVFMWDHYWPGRIVDLTHRGNRHRPYQFMVECQSAMDGVWTMPYSAAHLRPAPEWNYPTDEEVKEIYEAYKATLELISSGWDEVPVPVKPGDKL